MENNKSFMSHRIYVWDLECKEWMAHENNKVCEPQDPLRLDIKDMVKKSKEKEIFML